MAPYVHILLQLQNCDSDLVDCDFFIENVYKSLHFVVVLDTQARVGVLVMLHGRDLTILLRVVATVIETLINGCNGRDGYRKNQETRSFHGGKLGKDV